MMRNYAWIGIALAACAAEPSADAPELADDSLAAATSSPAAEPPPPERTIRPDGIGVARIGMTVGQLRMALTPDLRLGELAPYMVDVNAIPVLQGTDTLYYALFVVGDDVSDSTTIELLATSHPDVRTYDGLGPGMTLGAAAALAGEPRLAYSTNEESREWAHFPYVQPSIMIRVQPVREEEMFAGEYMTQGEYNETSTYDPNARVMMIVVRRE